MTTEVEKTPIQPTPEATNKLSKTKLAFLYILIGGLVLSALISITAILLGEFNSVIQKALLTTLVLMSHGLLVLAIVSADKNNQLGRRIVPTVILGTVLANIITTTLGTWNIWDDDISWRAFYFYFLAIGSAFLITGTLKMRLNHRLVLTLTYLTAGFIVIWSLILVPWVFIDHELLGDFYFRLVGALTILAVTISVVTAIVRSITLAQQPSLKASIPVNEKIPGGMLAILISVGSVVAIVWFFSFLAFLITAFQTTT